MDAFCVPYPQEQLLRKCTGIHQHRLTSSHRLSSDHWPHRYLKPYFRHPHNPSHTSCLCAILDHVLFSSPSHRLSFLRESPSYESSPVGPRGSPYSSALIKRAATVIPRKFLSAYSRAEVEVSCPPQSVTQTATLTIPILSLQPP